MGVYQSYDDQELLRLLKRDDAAAFTEIYNRYWKKLFTLAAHKLSDLNEAEDIVQNMFITIWKRRAVIEITTSLNSYLAVAVKYHVMKALNRRFKRKTTCEEQATMEILEFADHSTQEWLDFQEVAKRLNILIDALPDKCKLVYKLNREKGYSQKQIAEELSISEKTVEAHMGKALRSLRIGLRNFFISL